MQHYPAPASLGEEGAVPCYIRPSFFHVNWSKDNVSLHSLTSDPSTGLHVDGSTGFLLVGNVTLQDQGVYHCQAFNRRGTAGESCSSSVM